MLDLGSGLSLTLTLIQGEVDRAQRYDTQEVYPTLIPFLGHS